MFCFYLDYLDFFAHTILTNDKQYENSWSKVTFLKLLWIIPFKLILSL